MKIRENAPEIAFEGYYDLFEGGYFNPENFLEDPEEARKVIRAMNLVEDYVNSLKEAGKALEY